MVASIRPEHLGAPDTAKRKPLRSGELAVVRDELAGLVAHDLRTPLAAISMNLDFVLGELPPGTPDPLRAALEDCRGANACAVRVVSDVAEAVLLSSGERRASIAEVDPGALVAAVVDGVAAEARARDVEITSSVESSSIQADAYLLARALERVVERAVWQGRGGGDVRIDLVAGVLTVQVSAPPARGPDPARSLGTHFAEAAMRAQGGSLRIESDGSALVFRLALPP
jgi:signal transduction histidine kinase